MRDMGRNRKRRNAALPPNLYENGSGYYTYRHPRTGKKYGMGKDRQAAMVAARHLNSELAPLPDLAERILQPPRRETFGAFLGWFESSIIPARNLSNSTKTDYRQKLVHIRAAFEELETDAITIAQVADFLNKLPAVNSNRFRSLLVLIFRYAIAQGKTTSNPAEATIPRPEQVTRQRLTIEGFSAVFAHAEPWMQNAMRLALQTLQRREDITRMKWEHIENGKLYVVQQKVEKRGTGRVAIRITPELQAVLDACLDEVDSPYIIHRKPERARASMKKDHPTQLAPEQISRAFQSARDASGFYSDLSQEARPTFHEIRALGVWLYEQQGINTDALAWGNPGTAMKGKYTSRHSEQWIEVENAGLDIPKIFPKFSQ